MNFWAFITIINLLLLILITIKKNKVINYLQKENFDEYRDIVRDLNSITENNISLLDQKIEKLNKIVEGSEKLIEKYGFIILTLDNFKNTVEPIEVKIARLEVLGFSISDISKILNIPQGEIKLLLEINKEK
jgi:ABC-type Na+ efflux pump permease subunit